MKSNVRFRSPSLRSRLSESSFGRTRAIALILADLNALNDMRFLATTRNHAFLTIPAGAVDDLFSNPLFPGITNGSALKAVEVPEVTAQIQLAVFDFDPNRGLLTLVFAETYLEETFNVSALTFHGARNASVWTDSYTLTGANPSHL